MTDEEVRTSLEELSQAIKLLSVTVKTSGYKAFDEHDPQLEQFTRDIERTCLFADKVIQRIHQDTGTLRDYPRADTGNLGSDEG